jgi:hypothetical protein
MGPLDEIVSLFQELTPQNWITVIGFFSTPMIVVWVWPKLRGVLVAVGSTVGCWLVVALWNGASFSTIPIWTPIIGSFCAFLCGTVLLIRRVYPLRDPSEGEWDR